jgi:hypothetical protein
LEFTFWVFKKNNFTTLHCPVFVPGLSGFCPAGFLEYIPAQWYFHSATMPLCMPYAQTKFINHPHHPVNAAVDSAGYMGV